MPAPCRTTTGRWRSRIKCPSGRPRTDGRASRDSERKESRGDSIAAARLLLSDRYLAFRLCYPAGPPVTAGPMRGRSSTPNHSPESSTRPAPKAPRPAAPVRAGPWRDAVAGRGSVIPVVVVPVMAAIPARVVAPTPVPVVARAPVMVVHGRGRRRRLGSTGGKSEKGQAQATSRQCASTQAKPRSCLLFGIHTPESSHPEGAEPKGSPRKLKKAL